MAISYNTELLDRYIAPGISEFTTCDAPDISATHPEAPHWLANHFLNSVFRGTFKSKFRQYAFNQILRAQVAFDDYQEARSLTSAFLAMGKLDNPAIREYFRAISRWESCLLNLQIFIDVMNKMKKDLQDEPVFVDGDGTVEQRAYGLANAAKHFGSDVFCNRHAEENTVPLWLTNSGLKTRSIEVTFQEIAKLVAEVAAAADELQDPKAFGDSA
ncbi:MAG: hypothetical protein IV084_02045 [Rugosibacter sp.]|nr:hypothetical protein [Rugosibacter sp.]